MGFAAWSAALFTLSQHSTKPARRVTHCSRMYFRGDSLVQAYSTPIPRISPLPICHAQAYSAPIQCMAYSPICAQKHTALPHYVLRDPRFASPRHTMLPSYSKFVDLHGKAHSVATPRVAKQTIHRLLAHGLAIQEEPTLISVSVSFVGR